MSNSVPQWMIDSKTAPSEQNKEVDMIVAGYIGAFRKRGFTQQQMGILMTSAFIMPLDEVERRLDAVLSCGAEGEEESSRNLCAYLVQQGHLFSGDDTDPCSIIEILKNTYGNEATFETLLTYPKLLSLWKTEEKRSSGVYSQENLEAEQILHEVSGVFPQI